MDDCPPLVVVGVNHRSAALGLRERLMVEEEGFGALFARFKNVGVTQALVLSTCDRVESHGNATVVANAAPAAYHRDLATHGRVPVSETPRRDVLFEAGGDPAVAEHLMHRLLHTDKETKG